MTNKYGKMKEKKQSLDELSKSLFMRNGILSLIFKYAIPAFADCELSEISKCFISNNPAFDPDDVNSIVHSLGCEDVSGKTKMDYCTAACYPKSKSHLIDAFINVEAQGYGETKKARKMRRNVYSARLVLNQIDAIEKVDYTKFVDAISIWIYMGKEKKKKGKIVVTPKVDYDYTTGKYTYIKNSQDESMLVVSIYLGESDNELIQVLNKLVDIEHIEENSKELEEKYGLKLKEEMKEMCSLDEYVRNEGIKVGKREGRKEGRKEGIESTMISNLKNVMEKLNMNLEDAMNLLNISAKDKKKYMNLIL